MGLFCLLWIPVFYFFRRSIAAERGLRHSFALLLGCLAAAFQYFFGPLVTPGGFGLSRWFSVFIDIVGMPALIPILAYWLLAELQKKRYRRLAFLENNDYPPSGLADFTLLWLIPLSAFNAVGNPHRFPISLVIVPLLWTAQAAGIAFFYNYIKRRSPWYNTAVLALSMVSMPLIASTSWWALYSQRTFIGILLLALCIVPAAVSLTMDYLRKT